MSFLTDFDIRFSEEGDLSSLKKWFSYEGACDDFPFGVDEMDMSLKNWIGFSKFRASLTGMVGNEVCAVGTLFLMPYRKVAHQCSFFLIVDPEHRCKGIGTSMVRNLMQLAKTRFRLESLYAELYDPSALFSILQRLGFEVFARQENFVRINGCGRPRILLEHFFS